MQKMKITKKIIFESKLQIIIIFAILLLSGIFIYAGGVNYLDEFLSDISSENNNEEGKITNENLDTDNDGLADRIEKAIGANIEKNDTDGDGYLDFEEVMNGYSPLIASPEGKLTPEEFIALKDKIKNTDLVFCEKILIAQENFAALASVAETTTPISATPSAASVKLSGPAVFKEEVSLSNKNWKYSFYAPADLDLDKEIPLVIGLHEFEGHAEEFIRFWQSDADKNGFLVVVLQSYPKTYPSGGTVESYPWLEISDFTKAVLANIEKKYKIDENKIFITGYSAGASASYIIALDSGIKLRGVIPIDGYLPLEAGIIDKLSKAKDVNFYVVHGANDAETEAIIKQEKILLQYGAKMEFRILPDMGEEYPAAEHENILKWMEGL